MSVARIERSEIRERRTRISLRSIRATRARASLRQALELGLGVGEFDEILRAGIGGGGERFDGGGAVGAQEVPFADIELRLAALVRLGGGGERRLGAALP